MNSDFEKKFVHAKKKRKTSRPAKNESSSSIKDVIKSSFFGAIIGLAVGFALMFLFNIIAFGRENPSSFVPFFALASLFISALICGFFSAKRNGKDYILCGIISGTIYILIIFFVSLLIHRAGGTESSFIPSVITRLIVLFLAIAGGFFASKKKSVPKHKHHR